MSKGERSPDRVSRRPKRRPHLPGVEQVEARLLLATLTVNSTADAVAVGDATLTLREAVALANGDTALVDPAALSADEQAQIVFPLNNGKGLADVIRFSIPPENGAAPHVIALGARLVVSAGEPLTIDGTTEPDFDPAAGVPVVVLDGGSATDVGLEIRADGGAVRGLAVVGFADQGILLLADGGLIAGNLVGLRPGGISDPNGDGGADDAGVLILDGSGNTVGGTAAADRNTVSGNAGAGVRLSGVGASGNLVAGNTLSANAGDGVVVAAGATANTIGGGNTVSGGGSAGILVEGASGNLVAGNAVSGNSLGGVVLSADSVGNSVGMGNTVSGHGPGIVVTGVGSSANLVLGNIVSGNSIAGVVVDAPANTIGGGNSLSGNAVGVSIGGPSASANLITGNAVSGAAVSGVVLDSGASGNTVGSGNVIGGGGGAGVAIIGVGTSGNLVAGNAIGTDVGGTIDLGNGGDGVAIVGGASGNTVGSGNVVGFNAVGVRLTNAGTSGNLVAGSRIASNDSEAVRFEAGASGNTVGAGTVLASNLGAGVILSGPGTSGNVVSGVAIGTDAVGTADLGNAVAGVLVEAGAAGNTIGPGNTIAFNPTGVTISGAGTSANLVTGNAIRSADAAGVAIGVGATGNTVGSGNVVGDNVGAGVAISGVGTSGNLVAGGAIGTDVGGTIDLGNGGDGVAISAGATGNTVGAGTVVAFNGGAGVRIDGAATLGNAVVGARIFSNVGLGIDLIGGANAGQAAPGLIGVRAFSPAAGTFTATVSGTAPAGTGPFRIDLFADASTDGPEGRLFLGTIIGVAAGGAFTSLDLALDPALFVGGVLPADLVFTATATDADGNTSEFSAALDPFLTTSANDGGDGSLRRAIENANVLPGRNAIGFAIPGAGPFVIEVGATTTLPLPAITEPIVLDGTTQPGYAGAPLVVVSGAGRALAIGLDVLASAGGPTAEESTAIRGLAVGGFTDFGIRVLAAASVRITANHVGFSLDTAGAVVPLANGDGEAEDAGIGLIGASGATVGGTAPADANVIGLTDGSGVLVSGAGDSGHLIAGNVIGTDVGGTIDLGNSAHGVALVSGARGTIVGPGNVLAFNGGAGVAIDGAGTTGNRVVGNFIGTDAPDGSELGNASGVSIAGGAAWNTVGAGNVIRFNGSGVLLLGLGTSANVVTGSSIRTNDADGVLIGSGASANTVGAGNTIQDNGTQGVRITAAGTSANLVVGNSISGNGGDGVRIEDGAAANTVGAGNTISGGTSTLLRLTGAGTSANLVTGNRVTGGAIGVAIDAGASANTVGGANTVSGAATAGISILNPGTSANLVTGNIVTDNGNGFSITQGGIRIEDGASANTVGAGNTISGNRIAGVAIAGAPSNLVAGNTISGNIGDGVRIEAGAAANTVGGAAEADGNVIADNPLLGVIITGAGSDGNRVLGNDVRGGGGGVWVAAGATANTIGEGNTISANVGAGIMFTSGGNAAIGNTVATNTASGVLVNSGGNTVSGNTIAGNGGDGVRISGPDADANLVAGNTVAGNSDDGIWLGAGASANTVGSGNVVTSNLASGIVLTGAGTSGNRVLGNRVGTDGAGAMGNAGDGIRVEAGASGNTLGGPTPAERNVVSANVGAGVRVDGAGTTGNLLTGNFVGIDASGTIALGNGGDGIALTDTAANTVGGINPTPGVLVAGNLASANGGSGIRIQNATGVLVAGNFVGTDLAGSAARGNSLHGIALVGSTQIALGLANASPGVLTGGNLASANRGAGIRLEAGSSANVLLGNVVGTDAAGTAALGNTAGGVVLASAPSNTIGSVADAGRNLVSGNAAVGVSVGGTGGGNLILRNFVGTDASGTAALPNSTQADGIGLLTGHNTISGVLASGNTNVGIYVAGPGALGNLIVGSLVGVDVSGSRPLGNGVDGIRLGQAATVGGAAAADGNTIASNGRHGVLIAGGLASGNLVLGNTVRDNGVTGVRLEYTAAANTISGNAISGNGADGVRLEIAFDNVIGPGNVVSGNSTSGIALAGSSTGNLVVGNTIVGNRVDGVRVEFGATANTVGAGNTISDSGVNGVTLITGGNAVANNTISNNAVDGVVAISGNNTVSGNAIDGNRGDGVRLSGPLAVGNLVSANAIRGSGVDGVLLEAGASGNTVGAGNVVSGSGRSGVVIAYAGTSGNLVAGNAIGTDLAGTIDLGNGSDGIRVEAGATANTVGGTAPADRNVISANAGSGLVLDADGTSGNLVLGNRIGTDAAGMAALGNGGDGIRISGGASANTVGSGNVASANVGAGIRVLGAGTVGNLVVATFVGTDAAGSAALGNGGDGVRVERGASANTIGGPSAPGRRNLISANGGSGVVIDGAATSGNVVAGNYVGTDAAGARALGNSALGIALRGTTGNVVGGANAAAGVLGLGNLVSGNAGVGIRLEGASGAVLAGNFVGTDAAGTVALGNAAGLVLIDATASRIGSDGDGRGDALEANVVSGNRGVGVSISGPAATGNVVAGNFVGTDPTGTIDLGNGTTPAPGTDFGPDDGAGVVIGPGASGSSVSGNLVANNVYAGILVAGTSGVSVSGNTVRSNGIDARAIAGVADPLGDAGTGIGFRDGASGGLASGNAVSGNIRGVLVRGGSDAVLVSGNLVEGQRLAGVVASGADGVTVAGNVVRSNGSPAFAPAGSAVDAGVGVGLRDGASGGLVDGNTISGNLGTGLRLDSAASGHQIARNQLADNGEDGILLLDGSARNTIGGAVLGVSRNVVIGNGRDGIRLSGAGTSGNLLLGNMIGSDAELGTPMGNAGDGVRIEAGAAGNTIGVGGGLGNAIATSGGAGIRLTGAGTTGNLVLGNGIGGVAGLGNAEGIRIDAGASANTVGSNLVFGNGIGGGIAILGRGTSANVVVDTTLYSNYGDGIRIAGGASANTVGGGVEVDSNSGPGVVLSGADTSGNLLTGSMVVRNGGGGVLIEEGASGNAIAAGNQIDANAAFGLMIRSGASANRVGPGVVVTRNIGPGIRIEGASTSGNLVVGSFIGTDAAGADGLGNLGDGLQIVGAAGNIVGGVDPAARNVISGNQGDGVALSAGASGNVVAGNAIGTDLAGTTSLGNRGSGVFIAEAPGNLVGGVANVIGGNGGFGVIVAGLASVGNRILFNRVGTNAVGAVGLGNTLGGVAVLDAVSTRIASNVIAGNGGNGVSLIRSPGRAAGSSATGTEVVANLIGVVGAGNVLPNAGLGLLIDGASRSIVVANAVSQGAGDAVLLVNGADDNLLADNRVGVEGAGTPAAKDRLSGVLVVGSSGNQLLGNTVAGHGGYGIGLVVARENRIERNTVGGVDGPGNGLGGVVIVESPNNLLANNSVLGNGGDGVALFGAGSSGNRLLSNVIGPGRANAGAGVRIDGAPGNTVGAAIGADPALNPLRNAIAGNLGDEVVIAGPGAAGNVVIDNLVGAADDPGSGVLVERGASGNLLSGNVISGHLGLGVAFLDGARANRLVGGVIGTTQDGSVARGNVLFGVLVRDSAANTIGGLGPADGVLIAANGQGLGADVQANVRVAGAGATGNVLAGNTIGTDRSRGRPLDPDTDAFAALLLVRRNDDPNLLAPEALEPEVEYSSEAAIGGRVDARSIGVLIDDGASGNLVGDGNLISGNRRGVAIRGASRNVVRGNLIGPGVGGDGRPFADRGTRNPIDADGEADASPPMGNGEGVFVERGSGNVIEGNTIGGNLFAGIQLDAGADGNRVEANAVGVAESGGLALPNLVGVLVYGGSGNAVERNAIAASPAAAVHVVNAATVFFRRGADGEQRGRPGPITSGNLVAGNVIGTATGSAPGLANLQGILVNDAPGNVVTGNTIAGSVQLGAQVFGRNAAGNVLRGNTIVGNGTGVRRQGFGAFLNQVPPGAEGIGDNLFSGNPNATGSRELNQGPTVQSVRPKAEGGRIGRIEVVFNGYVTPESALNRANYRLSALGVPIEVVPVEYDELARRVVLALPDASRRPDATTGRYQLTLVGGGANGLRTVAGAQVIPFDGNFDGATGDNYTRDFVGMEAQEPIIPSGAPRGRRVPPPAPAGVDQLARAGQLGEAMPGARRRRG